MKNQQAAAALGIIENRLTARSRNLHLKLNCIGNSTIKIYNPVLLYMDSFKKTEQKCTENFAPKSTKWLIYLPNQG